MATAISRAATNKKGAVLYKKRLSLASITLPRIVTELWFASFIAPLGEFMSEIKYLSTTALAKQLHKEAKELFVLLARAHWMIKVDDRWQLTEKGKFEGGVYLHHPKFGDYVAWPESVLTHGIWQSLPEAPLTVSQLGHKFGLPARLLNLLLADLGWQTKGLKGWQITDNGRARGGQQHRAEDSAIPFVMWPESLETLPELMNAVMALQVGAGLDGRHYHDAVEGRLGTWLYLLGVTFALRRTVGGSPLAVSFYLPVEQVFIQCWPSAASSRDLVDKLAMQDWLKGRRVVEFDAEAVGSVSDLDHWLPGKLLLQGVVTY